MKDAAERAQAIIERFVLDLLPPGSTVVDRAILKRLSDKLRTINKDLISDTVERVRSNDASDETLEGSFGIFDSSASRNLPLTSEEDAVVGHELDRLSGFVFYRLSARLHLVVIVGMGGIGKTTLARSLYNSTLTLVEQFEVTGWVTVSRDFSARDLLVSLMASIQPFIRQPKHRDESIEDHIHKNLKGRRFLIVIDDVWSPEALRLLMRTFPDDGNESRILITTRQKEVASDYYADPKIPTHFHTMRMMSAEESYDLLVKKLFRNGDVPPELGYRLTNLATICGGLPLALVLVAGILLACNEPYEWDYVYQYLLIAKGHNNMVHTILSLSYKHLPHCLRSCLLYLGSFPEDHEINVARLVKQLSAQGFRYKSDEVGQCVQYLINRSLVSVLRWKSDDRIIKSVRVHDMVRDFCLEKAREEKFLHCVVDDDSNRDVTGGKIKVSFNLDNLKRICNSDEDADDHTHTIMCFGRGRTRSRTMASIGRFRLLKSLDLANLEIESFPNEVLNLFLLRLLALGHVPELPPSVSNLRYLETLIVNDAKDASSSSIITLPRILCLPYEIWTISGLRHIVSFCCGELPSPNREQSRPPLENLETLSAVMNPDFSEDLIRMIQNVTKLGIFYFGAEGATHWIENIERLRRLEKLKVWVLVPFSSPQDLYLGFPTMLRKLTLRGIRLSDQDMTSIGLLPRLQVLKLRRNDFEGDEWRVITHGFEMLEYLLLEELGLRHWFLDDSSGPLRNMNHMNHPLPQNLTFGDPFANFSPFRFPMLKTLVIRTCNELNEIDEVVHSIPSMKEITVVGCKNKSLVESVRRVTQSNESITVRIGRHG